MNILIIGSGGREHTFAWKMKQSPYAEKIFVAPGNAGTASIATNLNVDVLDFEGVKNAVIENTIEMVIVGPEVPLVEGLRDFFENDHILKFVRFIGPAAAAAQLEGSKEFAKDFMSRQNIPTAAYQSFDKSQLDAAFTFLESLQPPYVLKADGLAAGKGVLILEDIDEAKNELRAMLLDAKFGQASQKVVIEEFLKGIELSVFVLSDGGHYMILPSAKDYKRIGEGDTGLNTGGMGAVSPVPFATADFLNKVEQRIVIPTIKGLKEQNLPYKGFIFIGLMKVGDDPYVIEYNVRMGDPETEVVIPRIENDFLKLLLAVSDGQLHKMDLRINPQTAATVVMVSGGYPETYEKNKTIKGLDDVKDSLVFHAGTSVKDDAVVSSGGRVLAVTALGNDHREALRKAYADIEKISFDKMYYRKDLGFDL
jgi:phosphoribosylamine--glycine ligase